MSESAQLDDSDSIEEKIEEDIPQNDASTDTENSMDVGAVFESYDANTDGHIEHSEYAFTKMKLKVVASLHS